MLNVSPQQLPTINASCNSVNVSCDVNVLRAMLVKEIQEKPASDSPITQAQTYNFPLLYLWSQQLFFIWGFAGFMSWQTLNHDILVISILMLLLLNVIQSLIAEKNTLNVFDAHNKSFLGARHAQPSESNCMELCSAKTLHKCSPVKCCMCNGENDRNRKLSQDWKVISLLKKKEVLWFPNFAVDLPSVHDIHLAKISERSGNLD